MVEELSKTFEKFLQWLEKRHNLNIFCGNTE